MIATRMGRHAERVGMSVTRLGLAHVAVAVVLGGSLFCIATDREYWPFSQYAMFSRAVHQAGAVRTFRLVGVTAEAPAREIPLEGHTALRPFDSSRLLVALQRMREGPNAQARLHEALDECLTAYETGRGAGTHQGPPLRAIRLYQADWDDVDPRAPARGRPDRETLVIEVAR